MVKYLLKIDLSCLDGQPSCPRGGSSDQTERREGAPAVSLAGEATADGAAFGTAAGGPTAAGRRFGVSVRTIRRWRARWRLDALQGLVPRYPRRRGRRITPRVVELIGQARRELEYGAQRTQLWLRRVHDVRVAVGTIQRVFRDIGLPRLR